MKKLYFLIITFMLLIVTLTVNAINVNDNSGYGYKITQTVNSFDTGLTQYQTDIGETTYNNIKYKQRVHVFFQKQTQDSKIVTWAVKSDAGKFVRLPVSAIAKNYEDTHPGWKVVGAINADQYTTGFGTDIPAKGKDYYSPQPYYSMIADGEGWFVYSGMPNGAQNILGFLQDGSSNPLISGSANISNGNVKLKGLYLYVLGENDERLAKVQVHKINETPRELETTVWTSYYDETQKVKDITVYGDLYVVKRATLAIANNSIDYQYKGSNAFNAFFGKGVISEVSSEATIGYGAFAIDTKDEYLKTQIQKGTKIMVQYELDGKFGEVESAIGYHTIHRYNGEDIKAGGSYNTNKYTRSIVGRTKDGKIFLMAVDMSNYSGMNADEINETLKYYNVDEAYQMDGGGSTTAVIKENGNFVVVNSPKDGSPRSIFNALLLVERETKTQTYNIDKNVYIKNKKDNE